MTGLYLLGIGVGILIAFLYKGTLFKGEPVPFVMELPNYRLPGAKNVTQLLWEKAKDFLQRAFSVIFIATIVVWFLQSFDLHMNMVTDSADSILAAISGILVPIFRPLGMGDWRICTSLISGFIAKESVGYPHWKCFLVLDKTVLRQGTVKEVYESSEFERIFSAGKEETWIKEDETND